MSLTKRAIRATFRRQVFARDQYRCCVCGLTVPAHLVESLLDAHHITPREDMPNGGYVPENGVSLCRGTDGLSCHEKAEAYLHGTNTDPNYSPTALYALVGSSHTTAYQASEKLT
jgi:5-methylcytosine-specific restriction endonuclease McrA